MIDQKESQVSFMPEKSEIMRESLRYLQEYQAIME